MPSFVSGSFPSVGVRGFCARAIIAAEKSFKTKLATSIASASVVPAQGKPSTGSSVAELVRAVREVEVKIHIDIAERLKAWINPYTHGTIAVGAASHAGHLTRGLANSLLAKQRRG